MPPKLEAETTATRPLHWTDIDGLVSDHWTLATDLARSFGRSGVDPQELESEATESLWRAAMRYEPARGDFDRFARRTIHRDLTRFTGRAAAPHMADVPQRVLDGTRPVRRATAELLEEGEDRPSVEAIAERANVTIRTVREVQALAHVHVGWEERDEDDDGEAAE